MSVENSAYLKWRYFETEIHFANSIKSILKSLYVPSGNPNCAHAMLLGKTNSIRLNEAAAHLFWWVEQNMGDKWDLHQNPMDVITSALKFNYKPSEEFDYNEYVCLCNHIEATADWHRVWDIGKLREAAEDWNMTVPTNPDPDPIFRLPKIQF